MARPRSRSRRRAALIAAASVVAGLLATEGLLRLFSPVEELDVPDWVREPEVWLELLHRRSEVPGLDYELRPGAEKVARGAMVRTNSLGMRDRERTLAKPPGTFRVAALGDSFTFGFGVEQGDTWPAVLERLLQDEDRSRAYEVLNFGVGGYSTRDEALVLRHKALRFDPDLVVVGYVGNDPETDPIQPLHAHWHEPEWWRHSHLLRLIERAKRGLAIESRGDGDYVRWLHRDPDKWRAVEHAFDDMREATAPRGTPVVIAVFPLVPDLAEQVRAAAAARGFTVVDLAAAFAARPPGTLDLPDGHPNDLGHEAAACAIRDALARAGLLPR